MINKAALSRRLKKSTELSYRAAALCVDAVLDAIAEGLARGERVELRGLGSFEVKSVTPRKTVFSNIPAHGRVVFRPAKRLRDSVWDTAKS